MIVKPKRASKPSRPSRDEFELEELANLLVEANQEGYEVILHIWQQESVKCRITKLDGQTQMVHSEVGYNESKVKFIDILKVESAPQ